MDAAVFIEMLNICETTQRHSPEYHRLIVHHRAPQISPHRHCDWRHSLNLGRALRVPLKELIHSALRHFHHRFSKCTLYCAELRYLSRYSDKLLSGIQFLAGMRDFSLLHSAKTCSRAHLACYPMVTRILWLGCEADHTPPSCAKVRNGGVTLLLPIHFCGLMLN